MLDNHYKNLMLLDKFFIIILNFVGLNTFGFNVGTKRQLFSIDRNDKFVFFYFYTKRDLWTAGDSCEIMMKINC